MRICIHPFYSYMLYYPGVQLKLRIVYETEHATHRYIFCGHRSSVYSGGLPHSCHLRIHVLEFKADLRSEGYSPFCGTKSHGALFLRYRKYMELLREKLEKDTDYIKNTEELTALDEELGRISSFPY